MKVGGRKMAISSSKLDQKKPFFGHVNLLIRVADQLALENFVMKMIRDTGLHVG
jgi:hypothetical protein